MNRNKEFFKYVIPTIISFTLTGIYSIVDGFFVGNSIGDVGLSSINIAYPISALIQSFGIGIGMGGSVRYSIEKAEKNNDRAKSFIGGTMQLLTIASLLCTILLYLFSEPLLRLLGADGEVLAQSKSYIDDCSGFIFSNFQYSLYTHYKKFRRCLLCHNNYDVRLYFKHYI